MHDIIIIGAGPAGLTAAIYGRRASKKVLVIEAKTYGGQIVNTLNIENYPGESHISGFEFATKLYQQAKDLGTEFLFEKVIKIKDNDTTKEVITNKNTYTAKTIIVATGLENRKLGLPEEDQLIGKGISYCATCDGSFYRGKTVAVVGGGNTALEDALYLSDIAEKVILIHRREEFRGEESTLNQLKEKKNVEFIINSNITKLNLEDTLSSIEITNKDGSISTIKVDGLFIAIGKNPENQFLEKIIDLDENGYILSGEDCTTNRKGIFVAGDNRKKEVRQLVTATSDGAIAAINAVKYINNRK